MSASAKPGGTDSVAYERADPLKDADYVIRCANSDGSPANNIQKLLVLGKS
ncbi:hypothetical protein [Streptomyces phaeolivaceus]|uniref:hypothetical protein n=1 Tax=Streptomyces phaeolivaceus TaxID=2653200 RepID=UPI00186A9B6D|nr:hypothetical protein [Streptomyces phaeolivaceus]